jgi:hypothetical protein
MTSSNTFCVTGYLLRSLPDFLGLVHPLAVVGCPDRGLHAPEEDVRGPGRVRSHLLLHRDIPAGLEGKLTAFFYYIRSWADVIKKFTPSLGIPYLGV